MKNESEELRRLAEDARAAAERERVAQEAQREKHDTQREIEERLRHIDESRRRKGEESRKSAETGRVVAEAAREISEEARSTAEEDRERNTEALADLLNRAEHWLADEGARAREKHDAEGKFGDRVSQIEQIAQSLAEHVRDVTREGSAIAGNNLDRINTVLSSVRDLAKQLREEASRLH
jgi:hypothetical protein